MMMNDTQAMTIYKLYCCNIRKRQDFAIYALQMFSIGKVTLNEFSWIMRQLFDNPDAWGISIHLRIIKCRRISHYPRIFNYRKGIFKYRLGIFKYRHEYKNDFSILNIKKKVSLSITDWLTQKYIWFTNYHFSYIYHFTFTLPIRINLLIHCLRASFHITLLFIIRRHLEIV